MQTNNYIFAFKLLLITLTIAVSSTQTLLAQDNPKQFQAYTDLSSPVAREILWLARIVYSESKLSQEQIVVAWVVRNRVKSQFRGATSYEGVARDPNQFSGLTPGDNQYQINTKLDYGDIKNNSWQNSIEIARAVYFADESLNPIAPTVRHFYSPISVIKDPKWVANKKPVLIMRDPETSFIRFAFYEGIR